MTFTEVDVPGGPDAPAHAREALRQRLAGQVGESVLADAGLLVSELVTNSVMHGQVGPDDAVGMSVSVREERVRVEVSDPGPGFDASPRRPGEPGGYGLFLVTQLADAWGVHEDDETRVWFELVRR